MVRSALTVPEQAEIWRAYRAGASLRSISRTLGRTMEALRTLVAATGGCRSARWLALASVGRRHCHLVYGVSWAGTSLVRTRGCYVRRWRTDDCREAIRGSVACIPMALLQHT